MNAALAEAEPAMAKRNDTSARIDVKSLARAKIAAATRDLSLAEYLSEIVMERADKDIEDWMAKNPTTKKPKPKAK